MSTAAGSISSVTSIGRPTCRASCVDRFERACDHGLVAGLRQPAADHLDGRRQAQVSIFLYSLPTRRRKARCRTRGAASQIAESPCPGRRVDPRSGAARIGTGPSAGRRLVIRRGRIVGDDQLVELRIHGRDSVQVVIVEITSIVSVSCSRVWLKRRRVAKKDKPIAVGLTTRVQRIVDDQVSAPGWP